MVLTQNIPLLQLKSNVNTQKNTKEWTQIFGTHTEYKNMGIQSIKIWVSQLTQRNHNSHRSLLAESIKYINTDLWYSYRVWWIWVSQLTQGCVGVHLMEARIAFGTHTEYEYGYHNSHKGIGTDRCCSKATREVGGWGRVPFSKNLMSPTPRRKWYLTTGRRAH